MHRLGIAEKAMGQVCISHSGDQFSSSRLDLGLSPLPFAHLQNGADVSMTLCISEIIKSKLKGHRKQSKGSSVTGKETKR